MNRLAPIVIFSFNRPAHLRRTLEALSKNDLAGESDLFVYCDGAKNAKQEQQVAENRAVAKQTRGFKSVSVIERERNYGLADNIISAVTEIVNRFGTIITLEDDVITSKGFLRYMNDALRLYADDAGVMHVSGYMFPNKKHLPQTFFFELPYPGGGWATWKRAWDHFSNDIDALYDYWSPRWKTFNKVGGDELQKQLEANKTGDLYTWFIKWHAAVLKMGGLTLYPHVSLTNNIGFDGTGSNCGEGSRFDVPHLADFIRVERIPVKENRKAARLIYHFYSGHWYSKRYRSMLWQKLRPSTNLQKRLRYHMQKLLGLLLDEPLIPEGKTVGYSVVRSEKAQVDQGRYTKVYPPYFMHDVRLGDYSYVAANCHILHCTIGKFCSIGPNFSCGLGIHPTNGISTAPMFYSTQKQNGVTLLHGVNRAQEFIPSSIGNDVFIGANVTVLDGVHIGDGAVIGTGAVVTKDIPPYAIAVGVPAAVIKYRFDAQTISALLEKRWWDGDETALEDVKRQFWDIEAFLQSP